MDQIELNYQVLPLHSRVYLGAMIIEGMLCIPQSSREALCILQPQPTGQVREKERKDERNR